MKKTTIIIISLAGALLFCLGLLLGIWLGTASDKEATPRVKARVQYYKDGLLWEKDEAPDFTDADVKELVYEGETMTYISHSQGFSLALPPDSRPDFLLAEQLVRFTSQSAEIIISRELVPDGYEAESYIGEYIHRYLLEPSYLEANRITLHKDAMEQIRDT